MRLLEKGILGVVGFAFTSLLVTQITGLLDAKALVNGLHQIGAWLSHLQAESRGHQLAAMLITWSIVFASLGLALYLTRQHLALRQLREGLSGYSRMHTALHGELRKLMQAEGDALTQFGVFANTVAWYLSAKLYGGEQSGKIIFIHFKGILVTLGENPDEHFGEELRNNLSKLPIVQSALAHGRPEYEDELASNPDPVRVRETNWTPPNCQSIMVVPISVSSGGAFGIYTNTPRFFADKRDKDTPKFLRTLLEIAAYKVCSSEAEAAESLPSAAR